MATIQLLDVAKHYGRKTILEKIQFDVEQNEFVVIVGPSGCGKTTLLRMIAGLETLSSGKILINEQCINNISPAKRDIAMVFQHYALYPHMTVFQNMAYGLKMRGMRADLIKQKVHEVASMLHLDEYLTHKPKDLSGGQRQRVAMGRAIVRSPAVFLFDEPLSNLDTTLRGRMRFELKKLHQTLGATSLYVTHDHIEAMTLASKMVVLNKGKLEQIGTPEEVYHHPTSVFVANFIGHHPVNFLPATINMKQQRIETKLGLHFPMPRFSQSVSQGQAVLLGIRPEYGFQVAAKDQGSLHCQVQEVEALGADKLLYVMGDGEQRLMIRVPADTESIDSQLDLNIIIHKANLFDEQTGMRLGGWDDKKYSLKNP